MRVACEKVRDRQQTEGAKIAKIRLRRRCCISSSTEQCRMCGVLSSTSILINQCWTNDGHIFRRNHGSMAFRASMNSIPEALDTSTADKYHFRETSKPLPFVHPRHDFSITRIRICCYSRDENFYRGISCFAVVHYPAQQENRTLSVVCFAFAYHYERSDRSTSLTAI